MARSSMGFKSKYDGMSRRKIVWVCKTCETPHDKEALGLTGKPTMCMYCKAPRYFHKFDSRKEHRRFCELRLLERTGNITDLKTQVPFEFIKNGQLITKYIADFVYFKNGLKIVEDVKGSKKHLTPEFKLKQRLMRAFEQIEITLTDWS